MYFDLTSKRKNWKLCKKSRGAPENGYSCKFIKVPQVPAVESIFQMNVQTSCFDVLNYHGSF